MLTLAERIIISNQYEILKTIQPDRAEEFGLSQEIVDRGYEYLYSELNPALADAPLPDACAIEVIDILDMHRAFDATYREAGENLPSDAVFEGFDANHEADHYGFARFFRRRMGRFPEQEAAVDNSHSATLDRYRRMIRIWKSLPDRFGLSKADVETILNA